MKQTGLQNIVIIRMSAIGDVLMLLPAVRLLQRVWPKVEIDWILDRRIAPLIESLDRINVIAIQKPRSIKDYFALRKKWSNKRYDLAISFQTSFRSNLLMATLNANQKIGFGKPYARELHAWFMNKTYDLPSKLHQVEVYYQLAEHIVKEECGDIDTQLLPEYLRLECDKSSKEWAETQLQSYKTWVAINPMASNPEKTWCLDRHVRLIEDIKSEYPGYGMMLTGGPEQAEIDFSNNIVKALNCDCLKFTGQTTLAQLAGLLSQAKLTIAPDTGSLHLANAVGSKVIGLYGITRPEYMGPYGQIDHCVDGFSKAVKFISNSDPGDWGWNKKAAGVNAINFITEDMVMKKVREILK